MVAPTPPGTDTSALSEILLPGNARPSDMVMTGDGTLWVAQARLSAIATIDPSGTVTQHRLPDDSNPPQPHDLQTSPDGGIWYSANDQLGRLDPAGTFTWWSDGSGDDNGPGPLTGPGIPRE